MARKKARHAEASTPSESPVVSDDDGIDINYHPTALQSNGKKTSIPKHTDEDALVQVEHLPDTMSEAGEESDSSSDGDTNPVGDIPMRWYDGHDHIGYSRSGEKITRANKPSALDLASDPSAWRKVYDEKNDKMIELSHDELKAIAQMRAGRYPRAAQNEEVDDVVAWSGPVLAHAVVSGNEPKRRFLPSRHEARQVVRLVRALRDGTVKPPADANSKDDRQYEYDVWADHLPKDVDDMTKTERARNVMHVPAPKPALPGNAESYNPPAEYLAGASEMRRWHRLDERDKGVKFLPHKFGSLRHVPAYERYIRERFDRCLDLYLAVRMVKDQRKTEVADELIPDLPKPRELRPFPTDVVAKFGPLPSRARAIDVHAGGMWLVCGCDDGRVRVLESATGYVRATWDLGSMVDKVDERVPAVNAVEWCPKERAFVFAAAVGKALVIVDASGMLGVNGEESGLAMQNVRKGEVLEDEDVAEKMRKAGIVWEEHNLEVRDTEEVQVEEEKSRMIVIRHGRLLRSLCWHRKGDYVACVGRDGNSGTVAVHRLTHRRSQIPFKKSPLVQAVKFHPTRPFFLVATMHHVRIYNLSQQQMVKTLKPGVSWISSLDVHPSGDHVLVTSYDRRVCWFDLDLSVRPYKTIRNHDKAVRVGKFHPVLPLFADGADDGAVHVFHGGVFDDLNRNAVIVPVRKLVGCSKIVDSLGVLDVVWHPRLPWLFVCGADGHVSLYADCWQGLVG